MGGVRDPCSIANDRTLYSKASVVKGQMPGHEAAAKPSSMVPEGLSQQVFTWGWGNNQCFSATTAKHLHNTAPGLQQCHAASLGECRPP